MIPDLVEKLRPYGIDQILPISIDKIIVAEWVRLKCRYGCSRYNTTWCCPPATPDPEKVRAILKEYSQALLLVGNKTCEDFYRNNSRKRAVQMRCWKGTVALERMLFLQGYYKAFGLVGECCGLCKTCAYPETCRFPSEKRPSVESFGIDVFGTLRNAGTHHTLAKDTQETYAYYAIILLE
ncbi:MAG: DUF2284 domain-containing protein [Desulfobacterales bacterium]